MKLFLSSLAVSTAQRAAFWDLLNKPADETELLLIENAADVEPQEPQWLLDNRLALEATGVHVKRADLCTASFEKLTRLLTTADVIWLGGGNTYYLRWLLRKTGADELIVRLVRENKIIYGGGSAGALIAGPTLAGFEEADDPADAPVVIKEGLGLVDFVPVPHWDDSTYHVIMQRAAQKVTAAGFQARPITQAQALIIIDDTLTIVE